MSEKKGTVFKNAKEKAEKRRAERHKRWAGRFPFNMLHDMWRGITGEPRN